MILKSRHMVLLTQLENPFRAVGWFVGSASGSCRLWSCLVNYIRTYMPLSPCRFFICIGWEQFANPTIMLWCTGLMFRMSAINCFTRWAEEQEMMISLHRSKMKLVGMFIENRKSGFWNQILNLVFLDHFAYWELHNDEKKFLKRLIHSFAKCIMIVTIDREQWEFIAVNSHTVALWCTLWSIQT